MKVSECSPSRSLRCLQFFPVGQGRVGICVPGVFISFFSCLLVLAIGVDMVSTAAAALHRCLTVWEGEKEEGLTVFPKDTLDLGFF